MICQGNNHKTPLRHSSLCAALLLLPRSCWGTWVLQRVQQGCTQPPSHGPGHIQPSNPKQTLPERRPFLSKGESSQSPAEEDMGTTELPTSRCTVASQQSSGETRLLDTSKSQDTRNSERTPPQNTFQMSPVSCSPQQHLPSLRLARSIHRVQKCYYSCTVQQDCHIEPPSHGRRPEKQL